jgi:amidase
MPAAFCDLVGLKPTAGRISGGPGVPTRWGHSVPAVVTRTVRDTAALLDAISGPAPGDVGHPRSFPGAGLLGRAGRPPGPLRIGVLDHAGDGGPEVEPVVRSAVRETADLLSDLGHHVQDGFPEPMLEPQVLKAFFDALSVTVVQTVQALADEIGPPAEGELDPVTEFWLRRGRELSGVELARIFHWQGGFRARMASWWESFDLLLSPVFSSPPKPVSWPWLETDGIQRSVDVLAFTAPFNTTGQPAISVPALVTADHEPIGIQLVAGLGREDLLVSVAAQLEEVRPWRDRRPPVFAA